MKLRTTFAPLASKFDANGWGLGAAALYTTNIGGKNVRFIAKYIDDRDATRRTKGDVTMLSVALKR